jgi:hypothetical protein
MRGRELEGQEALEQAYGDRGYSWVLIAVLTALPVVGAAVWFVFG